MDNTFKTICAQNCTRARFAFKDAQKWTICAFVKMVKIYEFLVVEYVYRIVNMQLETWITFLKPFGHRFALVNVLCSRMRKSARFVHSSKFMSLEFQKMYLELLICNWGLG